MNEIERKDSCGVLEYRSLGQDQFDLEIKKGVDDFDNGRVISADEVEAEMNNVSQHTISREKALRKLNKTRALAKANGLSEMTLDEINEEIRLAREVQDQKQC